MGAKIAGNVIERMASASPQKEWLGAWRFLAMGAKSVGKEGNFKIDQKAGRLKLFRKEVVLKPKKHNQNVRSLRNR